jgi:hypothetical protein
MRECMKNFLLPAVLVALTACAPASQTSAPDADHQAHQMQLEHVEPDEQGRQLHGMQHEMDAEMIAELQTRDVFAGYTDEQLVRVMGLMGPNYTWPVSSADQRGKQGVLVLVHGFGAHGDAVLREQLQPLAGEQPTALAIGMSMMTSAHIQLGLDDLTAAGARDIAVIPVVSTRHNTLMRQWDYIFGRRDEPEYGRVPRVSSSARLHIAAPADDHPLVGEILIDYAAEISVNPANEEVIIVGHGPVDEDDNRSQIALMENLAAMVAASNDFAAVHVISLQDDAPREVRVARAWELRTLAAQANEQGRDVLVITNLLGTRIVQSSLRRYLRGLNYRFNDKGLIQHDKYIEWVNVSVAESLR